MNLPEDVFKEFSRLASELSPENLHCDGEISNAEANRKYRRLMKEWRSLEKKVGRTVTEDEILNKNIEKMHKNSESRSA